MTVNIRELSSTQIDAWITPARLAPYLNVTGAADVGLAARLYVWNARLASACMETIHHVEVLVRNAINRRLSASQSPDSLRSWLVDPDVLKPGELQAVENAITRIQRVGKSATTHRVISGLPLSFWARLTGTVYEDLWKASLHRAFPHSSGLRRDVAGPLNRISQLRNDIAHHQPLIDVPIAARRRDLLDLAAAVDPAAAVWISALSRVEDVLAETPASR